MCTLQTLNESITKFWELESISVKPAYSPEESQCEAYFKTILERSSDGRFVVALPFRDNAPLLGDSRKNAIKRFYSLEKGLNKNPKLKAEYSAFMKEYSELGHMRHVQDSELERIPASHFYLPHHAVVKESSLTTKVRVVYDASAKSSTNVSLNDTLMIGPKLQQDLFDILARFRTHKYVLTADITKLYRQIRVKEVCMPYQRILWRESETDAVQTFELTTVTYGTASASYLAVRCLQQLAHEQLNNYPMGARVILRDFYVDDLLTGTNDYHQALKIKDQVMQILSKGKFELRKWASNTPELLRDMPGDATDHLVLDLDSAGDLSTLGLQWNAKADTLKYSTQASNPKTMTKRSILSLIHTRAYGNHTCRKLEA